MKSCIQSTCSRGDGGWGAWVMGLVLGTALPSIAKLDIPVIYSVWEVSGVVIPSHPCLPSGLCPRPPCVGARGISDPVVTACRWKMQLYPPNWARAKSCSFVFQPDQCSSFKSLGNLVAGGTSVGLAWERLLRFPPREGWEGFPSEARLPQLHPGTGDALGALSSHSGISSLRKCRISHFDPASSY